MKKSHIITYSVGVGLMLVSYLLYQLVYLPEPNKYFFDMYHSFGFLFMVAPMLFELAFKRDLPLSITICFYVFIFSSQIAGTAYHCYTTVPVLDSICHAFSGALITVFIAYISQPVIKNNHWAYVLLYLVGVSMLVGVIWEIGEYFGDEWFGMNNQHFRENGVEFVGHRALTDTMIDYIMDLLGALAGASGIIFHQQYKLKKQGNV